ncbi:unnamed protein product [Ectocarpus sp. 12 AP-2014]
MSVLLTRDLPPHWCVVSRTWHAEKRELASQYFPLAMSWNKGHRCVVHIICQKSGVPAIHPTFTWRLAPRHETRHLYSSSWKHPHPTQTLLAYHWALLFSVAPDPLINHGVAMCGSRRSRVTVY